MLVTVPSCTGTFIFYFQRLCLHHHSNSDRHERNRRKTTNGRQSTRSPRVIRCLRWRHRRRRRRRRRRRSTETRFVCFRDASPKKSPIGVEICPCVRSRQRVCVVVCVVAKSVSNASPGITAKQPAHRKCEKGGEDVASRLDGASNLTPSGQWGSAVVINTNYDPTLSIYPL